MITCIADSDMNNRKLGVVYMQGKWSRRGRTGGDGFKEVVMAYVFFLLTFK